MLTDAILDAARRRGDPLADAIVAAIYQSGDTPAVARLLGGLMKDDPQQTATLPPAVQAYFAKTDWPIARSPESVAAGEKLFSEHGPEILMLLCCYSLPSSYGAKKGVQVLHRTAYLAKRPNRRLFETAQFIVDVLSPGGLAKGGAGLRTALKVRLMHAAIRHLILADTTNKWPIDDLGVPINQEDLLGTLMTFTWLILDGLARLGVKLTVEEQQAYLDTWLAVGTLMGIEPQLLPATVEDAKALTELIERRQVAESPEGREMMQALLGMMTSNLPAMFSTMPSCMIREFLPPDVATFLGVPSHKLEETMLRLTDEALRPLQRFINREAKRSALVRTFSIHMLRWMLKVELDGQPARFALPDSLQQDWQIAPPDSEESFWKKLEERARTAGLMIVFVIASAVVAAAQPAFTAIDRPLRVFIDCRSGGCDQEFFRKELSWVDHVRDQKDADVHVLVTGQSTGGGGTEYRIRFIGVGSFSPAEDTFTRNTEAGETEDGRRRMLLQAFALGLIRFAAVTPVASQLKITPPSSTVATQTTAANDKWNFWVFRTGFNVGMDGEASSSFRNFNLNQSANRITNAWKININAGGNYSSSEYDLGDGERFRSTRKGWNVNSLAVKSLTDHWSAGLKAGALRSSFNNQKLNVRVAPGIEWNFFPYSKSTDRQLTFQWTAGLNRFVYDELTIFLKTEETMFDQSLMSFLNLRQPFGSINVTFEAGHFFNDVGKYKTKLFVDTELRLTRGLSLNIDGSYQILHDQLYLRLGDSTNEEIIARQRQLETSFRYFAFVGITYRFGSINNNIVNQRFNGNVFF
jgi:hypothetical protein